MTRHNIIYQRLSTIFFILSLVLFVASMLGNDIGGNTDKMARKTAERLGKRIEVLDHYIELAQETDIREQLRLEDLPEDMVIYRYMNDSLQSWCHQFTVTNDNIARRLVFQRLTNLKSKLISPLADVTDSISYMNIGPKWYIVKCAHTNVNVKIIAGIEVKNSLIDDANRNNNGVNPKLKLPDRYFVVPLNNSGGSAVSIDGKPLFKIIYDTNSATPFFNNSSLRWIALMLLVVTTLLFLAGHRTFRTYAVTVPILTILYGISYAWGRQMSVNTDIFSPNIYAEGEFFFSIGSLLLTNAYILAISISTYLINGRITELARRHRKNRNKILAAYGILGAMAALATIIYIHFTLRSLLLNSSVSMELHRVGGSFGYTLLSYLSYSTLLICILFQLQNLRPIIREYTGWHYDVFQTKPLLAATLIFAIYLTAAASVFGFSREKERVTVWANRLAVERDLGLEIQLKASEEALASDQVISKLCQFENAGSLIQNRIQEYYLSRTRKSYDIDVTIVREDNRQDIMLFNEMMVSGEPIAKDSRFLFHMDGNGHHRYIGTFIFYSQENGLARMFVRIEPRENREDKGYDSLLGRFSSPDDIRIPALYSYAKYTDNRLMSFKGNFPYPTRFGKKQGTLLINDAHTKVVNDRRYIHFINHVSKDEAIIISRPQRDVMVFFTSCSFLFLILSAIIIPLLSRRKKKNAAFRNNYFKTRINAILFMSSFLILISMMIISVVFVYKRNETNMTNLMSSKISTIQTLVEAKTRQTTNWQELMTQDFAAEIENISNTTKSDITLYTPSGKVFRSTTPEVFEKMILGSRIDQNAFDNIKFRNQRIFINREKIGDTYYWALYAPVFNDRGDLIAIMSTPYTDKSFDLKKETFLHIAMILNLFLLLLIASLIFSTREVDAMFSPLIEMGRKMNSTDINNLEIIEYDRNDEITSLVEAYNRMVNDLSESSKQLAQAERDKAWSQMARQVAHEIKNPLTPIKLEIQRLIRLKEKNNPLWEEKFDKVTEVILEHIDILTDTANEFSTFAKLYTEKPSLMDLDRTLKDQILIFDNKENIDISYIGLEKAEVMAPRPQLIRVFVNLLTNAIQAVEMMQKDALEKGLPPIMGKILICLRNSTKDGYYDIVFDDNGAGVKDENLSRLFTPNFTTKSGGTGLGLAICRNIIEKCEGEIRYSRSFSLGGASFTVTFPKYRG